METVESFARRSKNKGMRVYIHVEALYRPRTGSSVGPYALRIYAENAIQQGYDLTVANDQSGTIISGGRFISYHGEG